MALIGKFAGWEPGLFRVRVMDATRLLYVTLNEGGSCAGFTLFVWRKGICSRRFFVYLYLFGKSWHFDR